MLLSINKNKIKTATISCSYINIASNYAKYNAAKCMYSTPPRKIEDYKSNKSLTYFTIRRKYTN